MYHLFVFDRLRKNKIMKKGTLKNDQVARIIDILKNYDLYEKLIKEIDKDFKDREQKER
jgi:hypothetical protein